MLNKETPRNIFLSIMVFLLIFAIASIPFVIYLTMFNGSLSSKSAEWSNLGSFLSGTSGTLLSSISILALIFTLYKTSKDAQKSHELTLKAIDYAKQQVTYMEREFKIKLFNGYIEHFNDTIERKEFFLIKNTCCLKVSRTDFIEEAYCNIGRLIWSKQSENNTGNMLEFDRHWPSLILSEMQCSFEGEIRDLYFILDTVDKCLDEELKAILQREYNSRIDEHILFWSLHYAYKNHPLIRKILVHNDSLFSNTLRCTKEILLGTEHAANKKGPPH